MYHDKQKSFWLPAMLMALLQQLHADHGVYTCMITDSPYLCSDISHVFMVSRCYGRYYVENAARPEIRDVTTNVHARAMQHSCLLWERLARLLVKLASTKVQNPRRPLGIKSQLLCDNSHVALGPRQQVIYTLVFKKVE